MSGRWPLVGRRAEVDGFVSALGSCQGFLICGPVGVGKTRLAEECLLAAESRGHSVARVTATVTAAGVPLGALAHLMPVRGPAVEMDPVVVFDAAVGAVRERAGTTALVLLVDDLPLLDVTSMWLLGQLLDAGLVFLLATVRTGEAVPPAVVELCGRDRVLRVDLTDLSESAVGTLLHLTLGGRSRLPPCRNSIGPVGKTCCSCGTWCTGRRRRAGWLCSTPCGSCWARWTARRACTSWSGSASAASGWSAARCWTCWPPRNRFRWPTCAMWASRYSKGWSGPG